MLSAALHVSSQVADSLGAGFFLLGLFLADHDDFTIDHFDNGHHGAVAGTRTVLDDAEVAAVIAEEFGAELCLMIVRKLQIPDNPEAGFGALTPDGFLLLNKRLIKHLGLTEVDILKQKEKALKSIRSRQEYFGNRAKPPSLNNRTAVIVDDGLASGFTMEAAVKSAKSLGAERIIIAVPTSSMSAYRRLESQVDKIIDIRDLV